LGVGRGGRELVAVNALALGLAAVAHLGVVDGEHAPRAGAAVKAWHPVLVDDEVSAGSHTYYLNATKHGADTERFWFGGLLSLLIMPAWRSADATGLARP
jgi:hypothetical protein